MRSITSPGQDPRNRQQPAEHLRTTTIREFDGGWNVIDTDLNLSTRFSTRERNVYRGFDGSKRVRYGTRQHAKLTGHSDIVNITYYGTNLIAVHTDGRVTATNARGEWTTIFDDDIAASLSGSPLGWTTTAFCSFDVFQGYLLIGNGINKPLQVDTQLNVTYLGDLASGSNANTPIGRYVAAGSNYVVWAGLLGRSTILSISNVDSRGTYLGDGSPNNAVEYDMSSRISGGDPTIKSIHFFRGQLIVGFEEQTAIVTLGALDASNNHTPNVADVISQHGSVSHRCVQALENDIFYSNLYGIPSLNRSALTETLRPAQASTLIAPDLQMRLQNLSVATLEDRVFSVFDNRAGQYILMVPNANGDNISETVGYVYSYIPTLKIKAWAEFRGWNFRAGCQTSLGNIFFTQGNEIFLYGSEENEIYADYEYSQEEWDDGTVWSDDTGWIYNLNRDNQLGGLKVAFDWILPWSDFAERARIKTIGSIQIDSEGKGEFDLKIYIDNFYIDKTWTGEPWTDGTLFDDSSGWFTEEVPTTPARNMEFVAGDADQYGLQLHGDSPYGGGRLSSDERIYKLDLRGKLFKIQLSKRVRAPVKFVSIMINWKLGSIRR